MTDVVVAGAGPAGLMLAGELATAGVDVEILERRTTQDLAGTRARGFHARTIEILDQRGLAERFLAEGTTVQALSFAGTPLEVADLPTRHPYTLALGQAPVERVLLGWVEELGVPVRRDAEVTGFAQDDSGVDVRLADGGCVRTAYLVGADGGRSRVRKEAGIDFVGAEPTRSYLIAEVEVTEEIQAGMRLDEVGVHAMNVMPEGTVGLVETERELHTDEPTLAELADALRAYYGTDFGVHSPRWMSRFTDATRQAAAYRSGRVLIAGDAAHTHPPTGGQGIGLGLQDAVNLGWKLVQVVQGVSPERLLDSYQAERHPATARVLKNVMVQASLQRQDARTDAVRDTFAELLADEGARNRLAARLTGLDVRHDLGEGHPLLGRRMPDVDLETDDGSRRAFELLHDGRHVLLDLTDTGLEVGAGTDRVRHVRARAADTWEVPVVGTVEATAALLVRPDGHVAWVSDGTAAGLEDVLRTWCGVR